MAYGFGGFSPWSVSSFLPDGRQKRQGGQAGQSNSPGERSSLFLGGFLPETQLGRDGAGWGGTATEVSRGEACPRRGTGQKCHFSSVPSLPKPPTPASSCRRHQIAVEVSRSQPCPFTLGPPLPLFLLLLHSTPSPVIVTFFVGCVGVPPHSISSCS